ncbi:MAG TPA: alpha/beta hydrolase [Caulobacteraceae bacterium]|nr:alpha/beta hydrolase [Caulobacteraceae bacterium]
MHVEIHGDGRAPHVLLVHGICSSRAQWRPNLAALAQHATPVVVELLGHGRSAAPDDPAAYAVEAYIDRFEAIRAELGAERWAVCGQSFGAGLTMNYALSRPERISAQVFTNSNSALRESGSASAPTPDQLAARAAAVEARGRAPLEAMPFFPKRTGRLAPDIEDELVGDAALISVRGMALGMSYTTPGLSVRDRLGDITTPTLLVNGRREKGFQAVRDLAAAEIAALEVVDLDGGHPVNLDCAEGFNAAVADFLARHP